LRCFRNSSPDSYRRASMTPLSCNSFSPSNSICFFVLKCLHIASMARPLMATHAVYAVA
jgi:hypothetical protein